MPGRHLLAFSSAAKKGKKTGEASLTVGEKEITVTALNSSLNRGVAMPHCGFHLDGKCRQMCGAKHRSYRATTVVAASFAVAAIFNLGGLKRISSVIRKTCKASRGRQFLLQHFSSKTVQVPSL